MKTTTVKLASSEREVTIGRPVFSQMPNAAAIYEELIESESAGGMLANQRFDYFIRGAIPDPQEREAFFADASSEEVLELFDAYVEFARFDDFLQAATERLHQKRMESIERQMRSTRAQMESFKRMKLVPEDFSIESYMREQFGGSLFPGLQAGSDTSSDSENAAASTRPTTPSSTTTSPPSTAGRRRR